MQQYKLIVLTAFPLIIIKGLYILNEKIGPLLHGNPIGLFGNGQSIWFTIIPVGIGLCGVFLTVVVVPLIFRSSFLHWKNEDVSWKWESPLALIIFLIGSFFNWPLQILAILTFPLGLAVFSISALTTAIVSAGTKFKSAFFWLNIGYLVTSVAGMCWTVYSLQFISM